jgi:nifR3 family TIM-barrel protein
MGSTEAIQKYQNSATAIILRRMNGRNLLNLVKPFRVGDVEIPFPVVLAPLAGYSDLAYRSICRRLGAPYCTTEMMLDRCVTLAGRQQRELLAHDEQDHPVAAQIVGNEPETMAAAAAALQDKGFDVIDLNFACPVNKALRRKRGGHMMQHPRQMLEIVRSVVAAVDRPVTLKVRQKYADADGEEAFWQLAAGAREAGAAAITVHARSVEQKYRGRADWDFLRRVKERCADWVVVGSGDILVPADALRMLAETGVDAVAAARGVLGNPWFFRQARDLAAGREPFRPDLTEQRRVMEEHMAAATALYGPVRGAKIMRKFGIRYARMHPTPKAVRVAFVGVRQPENWHSVLAEYYPNR